MSIMGKASDTKADTKTSNPTSVAYDQNLPRNHNVMRNENRATAPAIMVDFWTVKELKTNMDMTRDSPA